MKREVETNKEITTNKGVEPAPAVKPVTLSTDSLRAPAATGNLWENRAAAYHMYDAPGVPVCSIAVLAYNRLAKTRRCVSCILKYTQDVAYELLLIDNGSDDGTLDFFQSVAHENKKIIRITKNIGMSYAWRAAKEVFSGKYLVLVSNDVYVTQHWLSNLLICYESDPRIGFVEPVSSHVSNYQQVDLSYRDYEDMQEQAALHNQSDPAKWEERMTLISIISLFSRQVLDSAGFIDTAYLHDFADDDLAARLRRSGYKLMLCRDTWICHDHDFRQLEDKDLTAFQASLAGGRAVYREKYHGIDPWDDIHNFEFTLLEPIQTHAFPAGKLRSLVIDGRCGSPVLEIRNLLRRRGLTDVESHAFTTGPKYVADLQSVAHSVHCDRIDAIPAYYADAHFDIAALCEPLNLYPAPTDVLKKASDLLKPGGLLLFKLRDTDTMNTFNVIKG